MTALKLQSYGRYRHLFSKKVKYLESEEKFYISVRSGSSDVNYEPKLYSAYHAEQMESNATS
jgi:hypothetical protein